jgi:hypothetical protein
LLDKNATVSEPRCGLPVKEQDFIINYDIKYRMGGDGTVMFGPHVGLWCRLPACELSVRVGPARYRHHNVCQPLRETSA